MATTKNGTLINTSVRSTMYRAGRKSKITKICIHHWGSNGQRHDNVVSYLSERRRINPTSAHYVASAGRINEIVNPNNTAWHAANGNPYTIGIEARPEMSDGDFETVAQLVAYLRRIYGNLPLIGHRDVLPTECPGKWYGKLDALSKRANEINNGKQSTKPTPVQSSNVWENSARIKGMSTAQIKDLQNKLVKAGHSVGSYGVDGSYKAGTTTAVKEFQKKHGLTVDGVAGPDTIKKLDSVIKASTPVKKTPVKKAPTTPAKKPAAKPTTKKLKVDGRFGMETVKEIQRRAGVKVDGRANKDTWAALQRKKGMKYVDGIISKQSYKAEELGNGIVAGKYWDYTGRGSSGSSLIKAIQKDLGVAQDGILYTNTIKKLQERLNSDSKYLS